MHSHESVARRRREAAEAGRACDLCRRLPFRMHAAIW